MRDATVLDARTDRAFAGSRDAAGAGGRAECVVLVHADDLRRQLLGEALRAAGFSVSEFSSVAEMERWPAGAIVVTHLRYFTPWWQDVGARHVVVLTDTPSNGEAVYMRTADAWILDLCVPNELVQLLHRVSGLAISSRN